MRARTFLLETSALIAISAGIAAWPAAVHGQTFTWQDNGLGVPTDYNDNNNWTPAGGPPGPGQSAFFDAGGSIDITVNADTAPDNWTFSTASQSYFIDGALITFSSPAVSGGGIVNLANSGQTITIVNDIDGPGGVLQNGNSTLVLAGFNTFTGQTVVNAGTLVGTGFLGGGLSGFSDHFVNAGATLRIENTLSAVASLNDGPSGGGTVQLGDGSGGSFGILSILGASPNATFSGNITGTGILDFAGVGTQTFTGNAVIDGNLSICGCATGVLEIRGGSFRFDATSGGGIVSVLSGTLLISGGGRLTNESQAEIDGIGPPATAIVTGAGSTWNVGGDMVIGAFGTENILTVADGGTLNVAFGIGLVAGTINIGTGGLAGAINTPFIFNGGQIVANFTNTYALATDVDGPGSLTKLGPGTLILPAANSFTYTGATNVNGGTLTVNSSIVSSSVLNVNAGATIGGTGELPNTNINGGTLAPGNSVGTITVTGNLVIAAGSTYAVEVAGGAADRTTVNGAASLAGNVSLIAAGSITPGTYTILSTTLGRTGSFALTSTQFGSFSATLNHTPTDVLLTLTPAMSQVSGLTPNTHPVANVIDNFANSGAPLPPGLVTLLNLPNNAVNGALAQINGEVATGVAPASMQLMNSFLSLLLNPFADSRGMGTFGPAMGFAPEQQPLPRNVPDAYAAAMPVKAPPAAFGQRWSVWGSAYGGANRTDGNLALGTNDLTARAYGFAVGADYRIAPGTLVGFALAGGATNWRVSGLGRGNSDAFQAGVYGSRQFGAGYVSGALAYSWHDVTTDRTVTFAGEQLKGRYDANNFGGRIEGGYRFATALVGITPYAALQAQNIRLPSYTETTAFGLPLFALSYASQSVTATRTELGLWFDRRLAQAGGAVLALRGRAAWANDHSSNRLVGAAFQSIPGGSFTVGGAEAPTNLALLSAGAELRFVNNVSVGGKFDGEFSSRAQTYTGAAYAKYTW